MNRKDNMGNKLIDVDCLKTLILDEGDILLNEGFKDKIMLLVKSLYATVQICFFSATINNKIINDCDTFINQENRVCVLLPDNLVITRSVTQWYIECDNFDIKNSAVIDIINKNKKNTIIVFFNSCQRLITTSETLSKIKPPIKHLTYSSRLENNDRVNTLNNFLSGNCKVLFASDVIARGIDIHSVSIIINYDMPNDTETYIHRIGRSGRGDVIGNSITLIGSKRDKDKLNYIIQIHKESIKKLDTLIEFNKT